MTNEVATFDEFIDAALQSAGYVETDDAFFVSGETFAEALRRWWHDVVQLSVSGDHEFAWVCSGCSQSVTSRGERLYALPMFDYLLWELCPRCSIALDQDDQ